MRGFARAGAVRTCMLKALDVGQEKCGADGDDALRRGDARSPEPLGQFLLRFASLRLQRVVVRARHVQGM